MVFQKITDENEKMNIFSSHRNENWIIPTSSDQEYILTIVDSLIASFCRLFCFDIQDVEQREASGWSYVMCSYVSCVHLKRLPGNVLGYGRTIKNVDYVILPGLKTTFLRNVIQPERFAPKDANNKCVLINIVLRLEYIQFGTLLKTTKKKISDTLSLIKTANINYIVDGITPTDFGVLEKINQGFSPGLILQYPFLKNYKGLAINLHQITHNQKFNTFHLYPFVLSKFWNNEQYLEVDMLTNSRSLYQKCSKQFYPNHALLITNYVRFVVSFGRILGKYIRSIMRSCRSCGLVFHNHQLAKTETLYTDHILACKTHNAKPSIAQKKIINRVLYMSKRFCKFENKLKQIYLEFDKSKYHTTLRPLMIGVLDFECCNVSIQQDFKSFQGRKGIPQSSIFVQKPLAYSHCLSSTYKELYIPPELKKVEVSFLDERKHNLRDFYLDLLISLRQKLLLYDNYLTSLLEKGRKPPEWKNLSFEEKTAHLTAYQCSFCALSGKVFRPVFHHNHLDQKKKLARAGNQEIIQLCSACNLHTFNGGQKTKTPLVYYCHNLSVYDRRVKA